MDRKSLAAIPESAGIYQMLNIRNGKRYIGQAGNLQRRLREHLNHYHSRRGPLYNAIRKHGWESFDFSVLEQVPLGSDLNEREQFWMDLFQCYRKANGYNLRPTAGTMRGWHHREDSRRRIAQAASQRTGERNNFFGWRHSDATRERLSEVHRGHRITEETRSKLRAARARNNRKRIRPIAQIDPATGQITRLWPSITLAARALGADASSIVGCCKRRRGHKITKGFNWRYLIPDHRHCLPYAPLVEACRYVHQDFVAAHLPGPEAIE